MRRIAVLTLPFLLAAVLTACGDDDDSGSSSDSTSPTTLASESTTADGGSSAAVVKFSSSEFGDILTDADGKTLYLFTRDTGTTSVCEEGCVDTWPPLTVTGTPTGDGMDADDLGTTTRTDGTTQVTFYGHPVYYFASDSAPGDTNGQGVGDIWFVIDKDGNAVKDAAGGGATETTKAAAGSSSGY